MQLPLWLQAAWWGLFAGGALVLGAAIGYLLTVPPRIVAAIIAFGSGVLNSAVAAVFLSNLSEGLSSASGMKKAGRSAR